MNNLQTVRGAIRFCRNEFDRAVRLSGSPAECQVEAKRLYTKNARGMWRKVQSDARRAVASATRHGLSAERPYTIRTLARGQKVIYGLCGSAVVPVR